MTKRHRVQAPDCSVTALEYEPSGRAKATLVLAHGAGAHQSHPFMVSMATAFAERGLHVFTFNFPYTEQKKRAPDRPPVLEATWKSMIKFVGRNGGLFIGGKSMGGRIASHVAAGDDVQIDGMIFLGYPLHPPGKEVTAARTKHLLAVKVPMLFVQGTRDALGTAKEVVAWVPKLAKGTQLFSVEGGDHSLSVLKSSGRVQADVYAQVQTAVVEWIGDRMMGHKR